MRNRFLFMKCIVLGALSFPTPFLLFFYTLAIFPKDDTVMARAFVVLFLMISGAMFGALFYYKDTALSSVKDWFPGKQQGVIRR